MAICEYGTSPFHISAHSTSLMGKAMSTFVYVSLFYYIFTHVTEIIEMIERSGLVSNVSFSFIQTLTLLELCRDTDCHSLNVTSVYSSLQILSRKRVVIRTDFFFYDISYNTMYL